MSLDEHQSTDIAAREQTLRQIAPGSDDNGAPRGTVREVLRIFARLGLTSFGGPIAHLGYFRTEFVTRRQWVDEKTYADIVAFCQFLPGPASSQVGISMGILRAGLWGGLAAWLGFTLPSALALIVFALATNGPEAASIFPWLHGLLVVAVAVVAQAVWGMATQLCPDRPRATIALVAAGLTLAWPVGLGQVAILAVGGLVGWLFLRNVGGQTTGAGQSTSRTPLRLAIPRPLAGGCLVVFGLLLLGLPLAQQLGASHGLALFASFYRAGALVFGGGHVVLPLLQAGVVQPGWVTTNQFLAGYGAAQAVPGPLFTFSAYLGAVEGPAPHGWLGAGIALMGIFLPSFLLVIGLLPFWDSVRRRTSFQAVLRGVNASVVGLLLAALYSPVWTSAILSTADFVLALGSFGALMFWKWPPWVVVLLTALAGAGLHWLALG